MKTLIRALCILLSSCAFVAHAETHALILTIGAYKGDIPPLQGVKYDIESAHAIARKMGVKDENIRYYKDDQVTLAGIRKAFDDLYERVAENDQVFIYYSGHGGRQRLENEDRCAASLITVDDQSFMDTEFEAQLKRLSNKAQKVIVFLDACHSGGATGTRSLSKADSPFTPKFYSKAGAESCDTPINIVTHTLQTQSRSIGKGVNNYVYIAAARDNEVSFDIANKGGVATQAWRDCITGAAQDKDGSGGLSADEIRLCAQEKVDRALAGAKAMGYLPHHVTISGNSNAVLAFPEPQALASVPPRPSAEIPALPAPVGAPANSPVGAPSPLPAAYHTLADIYNNRDDRRVVALQAGQSGQPKVKVGVDSISFNLSSDQPGYVYLLMVGTDGKTFDMLFPNQLDGNNQILAGETLKLPRPAWEIKASGPKGKDYLLAIVADAPRDFSKIGLQPAGPFSAVPANVASSKDIQLVTSTSSHASAGECQQPSSTRSLVVKQRCSNAYGAAMLTVEETE
jgi:hypothetical protein